MKNSEAINKVEIVTREFLGLYVGNAYFATEFEQFEYCNLPPGYRGMIAKP